MESRTTTLPAGCFDPQWSIRECLISGWLTHRRCVVLMPEHEPDRVTVLQQLDEFVRICLAASNPEWPTPAEMARHAHNPKDRPVTEYAAMTAMAAAMLLGFVELLTHMALCCMSTPPWWRPAALNYSSVRSSTASPEDTKKNKQVLRVSFSWAIGPPGCDDEADKRTDKSSGNKCKKDDKNNKTNKEVATARPTTWTVVRHFSNPTLFELLLSMDMRADAIRYDPPLPPWLCVEWPLSLERRLALATALFDPPLRVPRLRHPIAAAAATARAATLTARTTTSTTSTAMCTKLDTAATPTLTATTSSSTTAMFTTNPVGHEHDHCEADGHDDDDDDGLDDVLSSFGEESDDDENACDDSRGDDDLVSVWDDCPPKIQRLDDGAASWTAWLFDPAKAHEHVFDPAHAHEHVGDASDSRAWEHVRAGALLVVANEDNEKPTAGGGPGGCGGVVTATTATTTTTTKTATTTRTTTTTTTILVAGGHACHGSESASAWHTSTSSVRCLLMTIGQRDRDGTQRFVQDILARFPAGGTMFWEALPLVALAGLKEGRLLRWFGEVQPDQLSARLHARSTSSGESVVMRAAGTGSGEVVRLLLAMGVGRHELDRPDVCGASVQFMCGLRNGQYLAAAVEQGQRLFAVYRHQMLALLETTTHLPSIRVLLSIIVDYLPVLPLPWPTVVQDEWRRCLAVGLPSQLTSDDDDKAEAPCIEIGSDAPRHGPTSDPASPAKGSRSRDELDLFDTHFPILSALNQQVS